MNEQTKKKYNRQRRLRQQKIKRQRKLFRIRVFASVVVAVIAILIILAIRGTFEKRAEVSTMTISGSQVIYEEIAPIGELDYEELVDFVKSETADVNGVRLVRVAKKGDSAYVRTMYDDISTYSEFTGYEGFLGTIAEAKRAGYDFDAVFSSVNEGAMGDSIKASKVKKEEDMKVLIIRENGRFCVDGDIRYVSTEDMNIIDGSTVEIAQTDGNEDATVLGYIVYE